MSSPIDPVERPLIAPPPAARAVARSRRSGDDDGRRSPHERGDERPRAEADADDGDDGFPHVDVHV